MNGCNDATSERGYYSLAMPLAFDSLNTSSDKLMYLSDEEILSLFAEELESNNKIAEEEDNNTFFGITLTDEEKAVLFTHEGHGLYGPRGYFVQIAHSKAGENQYRNVNANWANASHRTAQGMLPQIEQFLSEILTRKGIPEELHKEFINGIIKSVHEKYSGKENQGKRAQEIKRLKALGNIALRVVA